jgi:general secretion pathway protein H
VVLAIIGAVGGLTIGGFRAFAKSELRGSASRLAGAIRYLFDRASTTGKIHRLVFEFETGKYWAEVSDDRFFMPRERETDESREKDAEEIAAEEAEEKEKREERAAAFETDGIDASRYEVTEWKSRRARFSSFQEVALKVGQVKGGKLASLFTPRYQQPVATGKGYLYFFPLGQTEPALVHVSDEEGQTYYSLLVHPLNGRVKVHSGYIEPRVDEQFDDEGNAVEPE